MSSYRIHSNLLMHLSFYGFPFRQNNKSHRRMADKKEVDVDSIEDEKTLEDMVGVEL